LKSYKKIGESVDTMTQSLVERRSNDDLMRRRMSSLESCEERQSDDITPEAISQRRVPLLKGRGYRIGREPATPHRVEMNPEEIFQ